MPANHAERRGRLQPLFTQTGADAALVTSLVNVRYLSGFSGSNAALLVTPERTVLATDFRYQTQAQAQSPDVELVIDRACASALAGRAAADGVRRLGFEAHHVTVETHDRLAGIDDDMSLVPLGHAVEKLRTVKDEDEIALLREACAISDRALAALLGGVAPGRTEREIARELDNHMFRLGAEDVAFSTIVATGPNSAIPHHRPTDRAVAAGDFLKIDFGARFEGYHADCTRTFVVGPGRSLPAAWQLEIYQLVRESQRAGRHALVPGVDVSEVDGTARDVIKSAGYGEYFGHGLGHGVGLEIHEAPLMGYDATGRLDGRTPVTVEPGIYLPGRGGVRIEDTLVVRDGGPELLTTTSKDLIVL